MPKTRKKSKVKNSINRCFIDKTIVKNAGDICAHCVNRLKKIFDNSADDLDKGLAALIIEGKKERRH